ncbi:DUF732 domain-containing protein [Mycolicibacterium sp. XJ662]
MKFARAAGVGAAVALFALAAAPLAGADADDEFLDALADNGLSFPPAAVDNVIGGGHSVCQGWSAGDSYSDRVADVAANIGGSQSLARVFVDAATSTLCPEYESELP